MKGAYAIASMIVAGFLAATSATAQPAPGTAEQQARLRDWAAGPWQAEGTYFSGFRNSLEFIDREKQASNPAPFNAEYAARYAEIREAAFGGRNIFDPTSTCLPWGLPLTIAYGLFDIAFTPTTLFMLYEGQGEERRVYLDGRGHPDDLEPQFNGHSIGHWEGDVLVIDSVNMRDDTQLEPSMPHSGSIRIVERWRQVEPDLIENRITIHDPGALTRPWDVTRVYRRRPEWRVMDAYCGENNRNYAVDGVNVVFDAEGNPLSRPAAGGGSE